jgi:hypothetical protein
MTYLGSEFIRSVKGSFRVGDLWPVAGEGLVGAAAEQEAVGEIQPLGGSLDEQRVDVWHEPAAPGETVAGVLGG